MSQFKSKWASLPAEFFLIAIFGCVLLFYIAWHSGALALTFATLMIAGLVFLQNYLTQQRLEEIKRDEREKYRPAAEMANLYLQMIESLAIAIDAKDQTSHGHVRRTQIYATELGRLMDVSDEEQEALMAGALLHDIGKLAVPEYILNKPGKLTKAESAKVRIHATVGGDIVSRVNFPFPVEDIVRYHHEKWDGTGYPKGLITDSIPLVARITSVVDFYDAIRCNRPFRAGLERTMALEILTSRAGSAFDPELVQVFAEHIDEFDQLISPHDLVEQVASVEIVNAAPSDTDGQSLVNDRNSGFSSIAEAQLEVFTLHEIAQTIGSSLTLQDTVALVSNKLSTIVPFDTCVIYLVDEKSGEAFPASAIGTHSEVFSSRRIKVGDGITGWVIANGSTRFSSFPEGERLRIPDEDVRDIKHVLAAPLKREDDTFGAISLYSQRDDGYTTDHVRLIQTVSEYASSAINNALTFEKTMKTALIDQLTELPNARAFYMSLEQRIAESQRLKNHEPITVMSMDLDDFKQVNDTLGHPTGDSFLKSIAVVLKNQLRQMDILARYEGDEFIAILPMASHKTSFLIAERIHSAISDHNFIAPSGETFDIGVSIGVASYSDDGETAEQLLTIARRNMQHDKRARRNPQFPQLRTAIQETLSSSL